MDNLDKPEPGALDAAYTLGRAIVSAIPYFGGPAVELLSAVITPPLVARRDRWMELIAEGLRELEGKIDGFTIESLSQNEVFITTVIQASQVALRNHQREKLEGLRNAVLNSALPDPLEEDQQLMFLNFVDTLTVGHMRLIRFSDNPSSWIAQNFGDANFTKEWQTDRQGSIDKLFPGAVKNLDLYNQILIDLKDRGLVEAKPRYGLASIRESSRANSATRAAQAGDLKQAFKLSTTDSKPESFEEFVQEAITYQIPHPRIGRLTPLGKAFASFLTSPV